MSTDPTILSVTAEQHFSGARQCVFDLLVDADTYPAIFNAAGPVAGIRDARMVGETRRIIELTDGSVFDETILAMERPSEHAYHWRGGVRGPFALVVAAGLARWSFEGDADGTVVRWRYDFELRSVLLYPFALIAAWLFKRWMKQALRTADAILRARRVGVPELRSVA